MELCRFPKLARTDAVMGRWMTASLAASIRIRAPAILGVMMNSGVNPGITALSRQSSLPLICH
jgi:hypothetical protein